MGWGASPRTAHSNAFDDTGCAFMATLPGDTPAAFQGAFARVKAFLNEQPSGPRILTLNAWTEGSYLETVEGGFRTVTSSASRCRRGAGGRS